MNFPNINKNGNFFSDRTGPLKHRLPIKIFLAWNVRITPHEDELIRPTGKNVYVVCQVELDKGGPEERPSIRWLKNGQEVNAFNVR